MSLFSSVSMIACLIGIIIAIMDALYPSEKYAKQIKMIFSLVFLSCIVVPFAKDDVELEDVYVSSEYSDENIKNKYDLTYDYFIKSIESNINMELMNKVNQKENLAEEILTSINIYEDNSISIREVKIVLSDMSKEEDAKRIILEAVGEDVEVLVEEYDNDGLVQ